MNFIDFLKESYLAEAVVDTVKSQNPDISPDIIDQYNDEALPKNDKSHLAWVIKQHKLGNITPETAHTIKPYIESYIKNKALIGDNIHKFDVDGLRAAVKRFHAADTSALADKDKNVKTLHEDDDIKVTQHKGWEAAAAMGKLPENNEHHTALNGHASWCISLRGGANKQYVSAYTKNGKHPIVSITNKHSGRKYALVMNPDSSLPEFRDEKDSRPDMEGFLSENPSIIDTKVGKFLHQKFPAARDYIDRFGGKNVDKLSSDDITKLYHDNSDNREFQNSLVQHKNVSPDLLVHDYENHTPNWTKNGFPSLASKKFPKEVLDKEVDKALVDGHRLPELARYGNLSKDHITKILENTETRHDLLSNNNIKFDSSHVDKLIKKGLAETGYADGLVNRTDNPDDIRKIYKASTHNNLPIEPSGYRRDNIRNTFAHALADNPHTPSDVLGGYLQNHYNGMNSVERNAIRSHKNFNTNSVHEMFNEMKKHDKGFRGDFNTLENIKLDQPTQDKIANHYLSNSEPAIRILLNSKSLTSKTANHVYDNWKDRGTDTKSNILGDSGTDKLSDKNIHHMLDNATDIFDKRNISGDLLRNVDFAKRPHLFDAIDVKDVHSFDGIRNNTLTSDMIDKLHSGNRWDDQAAIEHPNTSTTLLKKLYDAKNANKSKVLDRGVIDKDVQDHIIKTSLSPINGRLNTNFKPIIKKLVNHTSADDSTYGKILKTMGGGNMNDPHSDGFKKEIYHEMSKNTDKMSNRNYNSLVSRPLLEKTFKDLLKNGNLTGEQLHNMVVNNKKNFFENYATERNGKYVYLQNNDVLEQVLKHPELKHETLSHMISNNKGDEFIAPENKNYALRLLQEKQGQLGLPFKKK